MEFDARMKPELNLTARSTWRDPVAEKPTGPGRAFWAAIVAVMIANGGGDHGLAGQRRRWGRSVVARRDRP